MDVKGIGVSEMDFGVRGVASSKSVDFGECEGGFE